ncbi:MAG: type II toxin-antitoxin system RelE/ParE family toxin [Candidatus Omnitrophica bacterium]|nr:type II toxin-antitoxin system RelE/ParE family toxin [Candidatus Omnitrophota bacterium]
MIYNLNSPELPKYEVIFYWNEKGRFPVQEFIDSLPEKTCEKIARWITLLKQQGPALERPYADKVQDKLYELRIRLGPDNIRILYFFYLRDKIILLHIFRKKNWGIERRDLDLAEKRMQNFIARHQSGKIKLES